MKKLIMLFIAFISLIGCGGDHQQEENTDPSVTPRPARESGRLLRISSAGPAAE